MQAVELQKCTLRDITLLREVALQSYQEHYMYLWTSEKYAWWYMDLSFGEANLQQQLTDPNTSFFFVKYNGEIAGFLKTVSNQSFDDSPAHKSLQIERVYLLKKVTSKGIGSKAVRKIIASAKESRLQTIWLKSMESSKAVQFYKKLGFQITKTEVLPFDGFKDEYRNIHVMRLDLLQN